MHVTPSSLYVGIIFSEESAVSLPVSVCFSKICVFTYYNVECREPKDYVMTAAE